MRNLGALVGSGLLIVGLTACGRPDPPPGIAWDEAGSGEPVVLIHGAYGDRRAWDRILPSLTDIHRVVRYDHRGWGDSAPPEGEYSPLRDLVGLLDALGIDRAHLVGSSLGGTLALDFALAHPDRVRRLVLIAALPSGQPLQAADRDAVTRVFEIAALEGSAAALELWLSLPMVIPAMTDPESAATVRALAEDNAGIFALSSWPEAALVPPAIERLEELAAPLLVITGDADGGVVQGAAWVLAGRVEGALWEALPGVGHLPEIEAPERVGPRIRAFLQAR